VIAHRLSTVLCADQIVVLNEGCVVGCGTHDDVLRECEVYRRLYQAQFQERLVRPLME
jgi:ABC-type multidrug transport system fused ATPase/permease subunit